MARDKLTSGPIRGIRQIGFPGLAAMIGIMACATARADYAEGIAAYDSGRYEQAVEEFRPLARQGDRDAQYQLGRMYQAGLGVPRDIVTAHAWLTLAAASGHRDASIRATQLEASMTPEQLSQSLRVARDLGLSEQSGTGPLARPNLPPDTRPPDTRSGSGPTLGRAVERSQVADIQRELTRLNYDPGPVDGILGAQTRRAIEAYQRDAELDADGRPSDTLLARLRNEVDAINPNPAGGLTREERLIPQAAITAIREELVAHGYDPGPMTGGIDRRLRNAVRAYQRDAGLAVDGRLTEALLDHLKFAQPQTYAR